MNKSTMLILGVLAALSPGCVTGGHPESASTTTAAPGHLRGNMAERFRYFTHGEPNVTIAAVDDWRTPLFATNFPVDPGRHLVTVNVAAFPIFNTTAAVALEFQAGRQYRLTAQKADGAYQLLFWDESGGRNPRTLLTTARIGHYVNVTNADSAVLRGSQTAALGYDPWSQSRVNIAAIDGQTVTPRFGRAPEIHVPPGKRLVTLQVLGASGTQANPVIEMEFDAGKTYRLTACEVDHGFDLMSWRELPDLETRALLKKTRVQGRRDNSGDLLLILLLMRK